MFGTSSRWLGTSVPAFVHARRAVCAGNESKPKLKTQSQQAARAITWQIVFTAGWLTGVIELMLFPPIRLQIGAFALLPYPIMGVAFIALIALFFPETKGKTVGFQKVCNECLRINIQVTEMTSRWMQKSAKVADVPVTYSTRSTLAMLSADQLSQK